MGFFSRLLGVFGLGRRRGARDLVSVVLLLGEKVSVDGLGRSEIGRRIAERISRLLETQEIFESKAAPLENQAEVLCFEGAPFAVIVSPTRYIDEPGENLSQYPVIREIIDGHAGWISCDIVREIEDEAISYQLIGMVLAEIAEQLGRLGKSQVILGTYDPSNGAVVPWSPRMLQELRGDHVRELVRGELAPVVRVSKDDPEIEAAAREARSRWPEFVAGFRRQAGEDFSVKARFTEGDESEVIWVLVTSIDDEQVRGELANAPVELRGIREGDQVTVAVKDVEDWLYIDKGGEMVGGFSVKVLTARQK